jgi:hypothetical protein
MISEAKTGTAPSGMNRLTKSVTITSFIVVAVSTGRPQVRD